MRLKSLAALAVAAVALSGCFGAPPNAAPTVTAHASLRDAAVGEMVIFSGTAYDSDGSIVRSEWDFDGDGAVDFANATRSTASFAYDRPGNFTATFRAFDDKGASASASLSVNVVARFTIGADWGSDAGFVVHTAQGLDAGLIHVQALQTGAPAPIEFGIGAGLAVVDNTTLRISMPRSSQELYNVTRVTVTYNGTKGGERVFRAVPFLSAENDSSVVYWADTSEARALPGGATTVTQHGTLAFHYTPSRAVATFAGEGSSVSSFQEGGVFSNATNAFSSLVWNHSIATVGGAYLTTDYAWSGTGVALTSSPGGFVTNISFSEFEGRRYLGNLTFERASGVGTFTGSAPGTDGSAAYSLFGNQTTDVVDGNGITQRALTLTEISSFNGTLGGAPYTETNITQRLDADSDRFVNLTIFASWNSTGRVGTTNISGSGSRYIDAGGDGHFNPDLRPAFPADGQYFNGLAPDELAEGDAFTVSNSLGGSARVVVDLVQTEVLVASGFAPESVQVGSVHGVVSGGGLAGALDLRVVLQGAHHHLRLRSNVDLSSATGSFSSSWTLSARGT